MGLSLGLLGSGGSILTVPLLVYVAHEPEKAAIAESLLIVGVVALVGSIVHLVQRKIVVNLVIAFGLPSMFSAYGGAYLSQFVSSQIQMLIFAAVMLGASVFMLKPVTGALSKNAALNAPYTSAQYLTLGIAGISVGMLAGLVGVGGGFLIVPALLVIAKIDMQRAIATSLTIIAMQSFAGFAKYLYLQNTQSLTFNFPLIVLVTLCAIVGVLVGAKVAQRLPQLRLKQLFGFALIPLSMFIVYSNV